MNLPTPEDMQREAEADMATCNVATSGPWLSYLDAVWGEPSGIGGVRCLAIGVGETRRLVPSDAAFIAMCRTALSAWIRRAADAEKHLQRRLDQVNAVQRAMGIVITDGMDGDDVTFAKMLRSRLDTATKRVKELET